MTTFPSAPTAVEAIDETGASTRAAVDSSGQFRLSLVKGHTYRFTVALASATEPVVFPRASNRLDTTVRISTDAATIDLGAIRHFDAAPTNGFSVKSANTTKPQDEGDDGADGECVDGKDGETNDDGEAADPTKPMAVPEHNAPDDVAGCTEPSGGDGDGETNDD